MRTNIDIDDELMAATLKYTGARTKKAAIEEALGFYVRLKKQGEIRKLFGKVQFHEGYDPKAMTKDKWAEAEDRWKQDQKRSAAKARSKAA